jgi:hypothetical protein
VIGVDVLGGFGKTGDWTTPLVSLTAVGDGTWSATVPLSGGPFPYIFEVHGSTDNVISVNQYAIDQTNPSFVPAPAQSPYQRSVSQLTLPQVAAPIYHLTGSVELSGEAQPCFVAEIDVGELDKPDSDEVLSEHGVANFVEIGADGTFDTPVADGPVLVNIKYPFGLSTTYPDPMTTPSLGVTRTTTTIAGADLALDAADFTYVTSAYAAMSPPSGTTAPAPIAFAWNLVAGATGSYMSITATNIAGSDPAYTSGSLGSAISASWDGTFNGGTKAVAGTTYYWGTWQQRDIWISESLEFPITLQ